MGVGFLLIEEEAMFESILLPHVHDILIHKKLLLISVIMAVKF